MEPYKLETLVRALPFLLSHNRFESSYDEEGDVLYITFEREAATDSELTDDDILVRYRNDRIVGLTVLNAKARLAALTAK